MSKEIRQNIGESIQIQGEFAHVDTEALSAFGVHTDKTLVTRQEAYDLFNQASENQGVPPLRDPKGYMPLDDNVYDYMKDAYIGEYEEQLDNIEQGFSYGTTYSMEAVLDKADKNVRKDLSKFIPDDTSYNEMRFVEATDDVKDVLDEYVTTRVNLTSAWSIRRSVEQDTLDRLIENLDTIGGKLTDVIGESMEHAHAELSAQYEDENAQDFGDAVLDLDVSELGL